MLHHDVVQGSGELQVRSSESDAILTIEAELVASALALKEAVFCSNMLTELGFGKECNQVTLHIDDNGNTARNRHSCI